MSHLTRYVLVCSLLLAALVLPKQQALAVLPLPSANFGYTLSKLVSMDWLEASTGGTQVSFSDTDDGISVPLVIPFLFRYFEHQYNSIIICTNGMISFDLTIDYCSPSNVHIPLDAQPNNIIAPFWDDLVVGAHNPGKVYTKFIDGSPKRFIIEWLNVTRFGSDDALSFQIVIDSDGNIIMNYLTTTGPTNQNTIGIEDGDGVDGIEAFFNGSGFASSLTAPLSLLYAYPTLNNYRVKATPTYQSGLLVNGIANFYFEVTNTGTSAENFSLPVPTLISGENWNYTYKDALTKNVISNTGQIAPGATKTILMTMTATSGALVGKYSKVKAKFASVTDSTRFFEVVVQGAISVPFIQMFSDYEKRINLDVVSQSHNFSVRTSEAYDFARSLTVSQISPNEYWYLSVWEVPSSSGIQYIRTNALSENSTPPITLTNNLGVSPSTFDTSPHIDTTQSTSAVSGVIFTRTILNSSSEMNDNVFLSRISRDGTKIGTPINLTNNPAFGIPTTQLVPFFLSPKITALNDRFIMTWTESFRDTSNAYLSDIWVAARNTDGNVVKNPAKITASTASIKYRDPNITRFDNNLIFLCYFAFDAGTPANNQLWLQRLDQNGVNIGSPIPLAIVQGRSLDMVRVGSNMLITWIDRQDMRVKYMFVTSEGVPVNGIMGLQSPDGRDMDYVSATFDYTDPDHRAVLTWENLQGDRLYYAAVNVSGEVTPPMIMRQGKGAIPVVHTGAPGASIAPLPFPLRWKLNLPAVVK